MSALALFCVKLGKKVSGSDIKQNSATKTLQKSGVKIYYKHSESNINHWLDLVVLSGAIREDNVELLKAKELGIKTITRGKMLGLVGELFNKVVSIAGTHGKSTTTSLVTGAFLSCGVDLCAHIGANVTFLKEYYNNAKENNELYNFKYGKNVLVTEACEYKSNFLYTKNYIGVITNIESEHLDYFKDYNNELIEFEKFAKNSKYLILNYNLKDKIHVLNSFVLFVAMNNQNADIYAKNIKVIKTGGYIFDCYIKGKLYASVVINLIGEYNIYNCLCALGVCYFFGLDVKKVIAFLHEFKGVERRMQKIGYINKCAVFLDYAHHPTEIINTLKAIQQNIASKKILVVFQPHTYSRTKLLFDSFVKVFTFFKYDLLFLPTYSARESASCGYTATVLFNAVKNKKPNCCYLQKKQCYKYIKDNISKYNYIFFVGAGDLDKIAKLLIKCKNN